ncbi:hypothetical protein C8T65DRAFT_745821 [Cerioporus squamosus]|nr:hypothetical protein C8T65DRAFT_745821 [Cerioporus squamosus]
MAVFTLFSTTWTSPVAVLAEFFNATMPSYHHDLHSVLFTSIAVLIIATIVVARSNYPLMPVNRLALELVHAASPGRPLYRSVLATSMLFCSSDEFSWVLLHAVYISRMSVELSASIRACRRVTAEDLGLSARPRAGDGDDAAGAPLSGTRLSIRRTQPSIPKSPSSLHAAFRDFLRAERLKPRHELPDIPSTFVTGTDTDTLVLRPSPGAAASVSAIHWAPGTNSVLVDRLRQLSLASTSSSAAARFDAALDDFLHAQRHKPRRARISCVWSPGLRVRGASR